MCLLLNFVTLSSSEFLLFVELNLLVVLGTSGMTYDFFLYPDQFFNSQMKSKYVFVVCFCHGKEDNYFLLLQRSLHRFNYCNFCTVFAANEVNGSRFLQASVEFGLSTEKVSLKQSLLSPFYFFAVLLHIDLCLDCFNWLTGAI